MIYDSSKKIVKVLKKKFFCSLMAQGFEDDFIGTEKNRVNSKFSVFIFKNSKELIDALNELIEKNNKNK